jgi:Mg2+ and Co2+ transporter CorA
MTDRELMQQALESLNRSDYLGWQLNIPIIKALRERLAKEDKNDFHPDWDTVKAYEDKFAEMLEEIQRLRVELKQTEARLHEMAKHCAELEFATSDPIVGTKTWFNEEGKIVQQELKRSEVYKDEPQDIGGHRFNAARVAAQREWKGLTEDEVDDIWNKYCDEMGEASINDAEDIARAIEVKLKEKNT